jgi:predicted nuclease of predicted toxin-antitoxin system
LGLASAADAEIFAIAQREQRILISADSDFGALLATRSESKPSVILFRKRSGRRPELQVSLLLKNLPNISQALEDGSVVVFDESRLRIRQLPIGAPRPLG